MPGLDRYTDLRFIAGFFAFNGGQFSDIEGWKLGVEWRPVPALVLSGTWYDDDHLRDGQWFAGIGFEIPLGVSWEELCRRHTRTLKERMTEPVHRNRQITLASGSKLERVEIQVVNQTSSGGRSSITIDSGLLVMSFVPTAGSIVNAFGKRFLVLPNGSLQLLGPGPSGPGFLLVVPEPSRALLLLMSAACLVLRRRRPEA